ncbi:mevalonate kinase [archaeon]|nr:mevalonate kinase [archaeon]
MVTASAPGKCIISGEHAVVYGEPAIIAAIGKRTYVEAEKSEKCRYIDPRWNIDTEFTVSEAMSCLKETNKLWQQCFEKKNFTEMFEFIKKDKWINYRKSFIATILKHLEIMEGVTIKIKTEVPTGSGLGSSSSLAVAGTKAVSELFGKKLSLEQLNDISYELEKIVHGTPSGGDNSASCFGGLLWFRKVQPKNEIISLKKEIPHKLENFVLVHTGEPKKTTGELVQMVRNLEENYRNERIQKIGKLVTEMKDTLKSKDYEKMKDTINENQKLLEELGVSTPDIDRIARAVRDINGAAKLCGAGGGGIMLCWHEDSKELAEIIKKLGYEPIETELGCEGVRIEK